MEFRRMVPVTGDSGNAPSIELHRRAGFEMAGVLPSIGWKRGRWVDGVLMVRRLGAGNQSPPMERGRLGKTDFSANTRSGLHTAGHFRSVEGVTRVPRKQTLS